MYEIKFFTNGKGEKPVKIYLDELTAKKDKDSRIKAAAIDRYITVLRRNGKAAGLPYVKPIDGDIWELRPIDDRIFFVAWQDNTMVLLHHYRKKSQKTPKQEIKQAQREYKEFLRQQEGGNDANGNKR